MDLLIGQRILIKSHVVSSNQKRSIEGVQDQINREHILGKTGTTGTYKTWLGLSDSILKL